MAYRNKAEVGVRGNCQGYSLPTQFCSLCILLWGLPWVLVKPIRAIESQTLLSNLWPCNCTHLTEKNTYIVETIYTFLWLTMYHRLIGHWLLFSSLFIYVFTFIFLFKYHVHFALEYGSFTYRLSSTFPRLLFINSIPIRWMVFCAPQNTSHVGHA